MKLFTKGWNFYIILTLKIIMMLILHDLLRMLHEMKGGACFGTWLYLKMWSSLTFMSGSFYFHWRNYFHPPPVAISSTVMHHEELFEWLDSDLSVMLKLARVQKYKWDHFLLKSFVMIAGHYRDKVWGW